MDSDYYDDVPRRRWISIIGIVLMVAAVGAGAFWLISPEGDGPTQLSGDVAAAAASTAPVQQRGPLTSAGAADRSSVVTTTVPAVPTAPESTAPESTVRESTVSTSVDSTPDSTVDPTPDSTVGSTVDSTVVPASATSTTSPAPTLPADAGYPTSPDGAPLPAVVIFDTGTITITGMVPSQAAKDRLAALALANSKTEAPVVNNLIVNPKVPAFVGVRVIELNSARFPEATATILPEHAKELDRVVAIMNALPNISVLVIGHADQRGNDGVNFATSDQRARAVVNYLLYLGISPTRLSSRAAGETELLTVNDDETALALNRRTEFIFYGLFVD